MNVSRVVINLGRVGMGRVLCGPSWHGPSWFLAELSVIRLIDLGTFQYIITITTGEYYRAWLVDFTHSLFTSGLLAV